MLSKVCFSLFVIVSFIEAAPQFPSRGFQPSGQDEPPQPYEFQYKVDNPQSRTVFGQNEAGDVQGKVVGSYYVLLPDGRLMNVEYTVDGDSGYVPKITFSPQNAPGTPASIRLG